MSQTAVDLLAAVTALVEQAKSVPMSSSCMVNRAEALKMLAEVAQAHDDEVAVAKRESGVTQVESAQEESARIIDQARADAARLVAEHDIVQQAQAEADTVRLAAQTEAEELKRESDAYVDQRMAELEAYMSKTLSQLQTMRARLSERSGLDDE